MKKIFLFVFILTTNWCVAQIYVNQENVNNTNYQYIEMWEKYNKRNGKLHVMIDYGQSLTPDDGNLQLKMRNSKGGVLEFNSIVAILNFMYMNGWELAATQTTEDIESYILQRRKNFSLPDIKEGATPSPTETSQY